VTQWAAVHVTTKVDILWKHAVAVAKRDVMTWECQLDQLWERGLCPGSLASLKRDSEEPKGGSERSRRTVAHSEAQGRGDKSAPREGTLLFRGEKGKLMRE